MNKKKQTQAQLPTGYVLLPKLPKEQRALTPEQQQQVQDHLTYAQHIGMKYHHPSVETKDLMQQSCLGLCEAALRFDSSKGVPFKQFAYTWCRKYVLMLLNQQYRNKETEDIVGLEEVLIDESQPTSYEHVQKLLTVLSDREQQIVCTYHGIDTSPHNFREIARDMDLTPARISQLYNQALLKMYHLER